MRSCTICDEKIQKEKLERHMGAKRGKIGHKGSIHDISFAALFRPAYSGLSARRINAGFSGWSSFKS
jgi:hypothetical protein